MVEERREGVVETDATTSLVDDKLDKTRLNTTEMAITSSIERREPARANRRSGQLVVTKAADAQKALVGS
jgi:hypothetical protein